MMHIKRFRHVAVVANDLRKLVDFYTQILGFEVKRRYEVKSADFQNGIGVPGAEATGVHLTMPNSDVELEMFQFTAPLMNFSRSPLPANQPGYRHMALVVDNLQDAYLELKTKGIPFLSEPITFKEPKEVAGFQFVYFRDPEGNIVELNQLPDWA
jgi:glyoxylase I family protein